MRRLPIFCAALALGLLAGAAPAQVKEPADLLPAQTLAYVELRHPDKLARELSALLKGSCLDDLPAFMARYRAKLPDEVRLYLFDDPVMTVGALLAPEMISEFGRLQGGILALTAIDKDGPQMVGVVLSGTSNVPGFAMRTWLTGEAGIRKKFEVEGVPIYRTRQQVWARPAQPFNPNQPPPPPPPPQWKDVGPHFAMLPGAVVIGSGEPTREVVKRFKGKSADPALSSLRAYKDTAKLREKPGLFAYVDVPAVSSHMDDSLKGKQPGEAMYWNAFKSVVNPRSIRSLTISLTLENGDLSLVLRANVDPRQSNPLLELAPDRKVNLAMLDAVPGDALLGLTFGLPDGAKRWQKLLAILDAVVKETGESDLNLPSKKIAKLEKELNLSLGQQVAAKVEDVAVSLDIRKGQPRPAVILAMKDAESAKTLEENIVPALLKHFSGRKDYPEPTREKVAGHTVKVLPDSIGLGSKTIAFGRAGKLVVLGQDPALVGECLNAGVKKNGLGSLRHVAGVLKGSENAQMVGTISLGQGLVSLMEVVESWDDGRRRFVKPNQPVQPEKPKPVFDKYVKQLAKLIEDLPPAVLTLTRNDDVVTLEIRQQNLRSHSARLLDTWMESSLDRGVRRWKNWNEGIGRGEAVPVPVPPPPR